MVRIRKVIYFSSDLKDQVPFADFNLECSCLPVYFKHDLKDH